MTRAVDDSVDRLLDLYYEEAAVDGPQVLGFTERALQGRYGPVERAVLMAFLDRLEVIIAGNIETRLEEAPGQEQQADEALEHTRQEFGRARDLVAGTGA